MNSAMSNTRKRDYTTVVVGVDTKTGAMAVGAKLSYVYGDTLCAEDLVVIQLTARGSQLENIRMTSAIRPFNGQIIPVCKRCQLWYEPSNFFPATPYKRGHHWDNQGLATGGFVR
jgi:cytidine deaminase